MTTNDFDKKEEQLFLELLAENVWKARREGAILGVVYTVLIVALLWATASLGSLSGISAAIYAACMVLLFDFWRRVFKKP
jgi:hypothetical protein